MPNTRVIRTSFGGGEISRELIGRVDNAGVQNGLDTCRNFVVQPHGSASNRPGTQFVRELKNSANPARLLSFSFSETQTFAIELAAGYFRFHTQAATLMDGAVPYEVANSYAQADLAGIRYVQSGDVITLVHPLYPPMELKRFGNLDWTFTAISFVSQTPTPTGCAAVATYPTAGVDKGFKYVVTALNSIGLEESLASAPSAPVTNDLTIAGNYNTVDWDAVAGAIRYNVYKYAGGSYGYIGQVAALTFVDDNILADLTRTIPIQDTVFDSPGNYPSAVCYFEQRRFFAGTLNEPQNVWSTQSASDYNISYSIPSQSSDALRFKIAAQRANSIRHMIPAQDMLLMTASTEWRIFSDGSALSPTSISIKAQSQNGATNIAPVTVGNYVIFVQAQGGHVREMSYQWQSSGYVSNDLCLLAPHLFNNRTIVDMAFSRAPVPIVWVVSSDGYLGGLTYIPEQDVAAWHKHDTVRGKFESICTVTENNADVLYMIVNRPVNGLTRRYIEVLHSRDFASPSDAFFVDCGLTYSNPVTPALVITGLEHLEGQTVAVLGDGAVMPQCVVSGGAITLDTAVSTAQIGLPITADLVTTPITLQQDANLGHSRVKNINKAWVQVYNSGLFETGPDAARLTPVKLRQFEPPGEPPALNSSEIALFVQPNYNQDGKLMIRQSNPLPLTVVSITMETTIGG